MPDTTDLIARARAALDGVTDGPWELDEETNRIKAPDGYEIAWDALKKDGLFIATARNLVPALLSALEASEARIVELHQVANNRIADQVARAEATKARERRLVDAAKGLLFAHDHGNGLEGWHNTRERLRAAIAEAEGGK